MQASRDELLARAVLAGDQHARLGRRDAVDGGQHLLHRVRLAEDARRVLAAQLEVLALELGVLERVARQQEHAVAVERLLEEVVRALLGRLDRRLDRAVARDHDDGQVGAALDDVAQDLHAVAAGHLDVEEDEADVLARIDGRQPGGAVLGQHRVDLRALQRHPQRLAHARVVVDDESFHGDLFDSVRCPLQGTLSGRKQARQGT